MNRTHEELYEAVVSAPMNVTQCHDLQENIKLFDLVKAGKIFYEPFNRIFSIQKLSQPNEINF